MNVQEHHEARETGPNTMGTHGEVDRDHAVEVRDAVHATGTGDSACSR